MLPVMHPYIHGLSDYRVVIDQLVQHGFYEMNWKGFRHDSRMTLMPKLPQYPDDGTELMLGEDIVSNYANQHGIQYVGLKEYLHRTNIKGVSEDVAKKQVEELMSMDIVVSSSDTREEVIKAVIRRRQ